MALVCTVRGTTLAPLQLSVCCLLLKHMLMRGRGVLPQPHCCRTCYFPYVFAPGTVLKQQQLVSIHIPTCTALCWCCCGVVACVDCLSSCTSVNAAAALEGQECFARLVIWVCIWHSMLSAAATVEVAGGGGSRQSNSYSYSIWHGKAVQPIREPEAQGGAPRLLAAMFCAAVLSVWRDRGQVCVGKVRVLYPALQL